MSNQINGKRVSVIKASVVFALLTFLVACNSKNMFYHNETEVAPDEAGVYTELQLNKNGSFVEYLYYSIGDSLESIDFGTVILGNYTFETDTLYLIYSLPDSSQPKNTTATVHYDEAYVLRKGKLAKLQPVTYSSHFVNLVMTPGKAERLRSRENYDSIIWKINNANDSTYTPKVK